MIDTEALLSLLGDETLVRKYLLRFTADMPELMRQIRSAYDRKAWSEISLHAHTYKCQMQYLNEAKATQLAHELERKSTEADPQQIPIGDLITRLEHRLSLTLEEIQRFTG